MITGTKRCKFKINKPDVIVKGGWGEPGEGLLSRNERGGATLIPERRRCNQSLARTGENIY